MAGKSTQASRDAKFRNIGAELGFSNDSDSDDFQLNLKQKHRKPTKKKSSAKPKKKAENTSPLLKSLNLSEDLKRPYVCDDNTNFVQPTSQPARGSMQNDNVKTSSLQSRRSSVLSGFNVIPQAGIHDCSIMSTSAFNPIANSTICFNPVASSTRYSGTPPSEEVESTFGNDQGQVRHFQFPLHDTLSSEENSEFDQQHNLITDQMKQVVVPESFDGDLCPSGTNNSNETLEVANPASTPVNVELRTPVRRERSELATPTNFPQRTTATGATGHSVGGQVSKTRTQDMISKHPGTIVSDTSAETRSEGRSGSYGVVLDSEAPETLPENMPGEVEKRKGGGVIAGTPEDQSQSQNDEEQHCLQRKESENLSVVLRSESVVNSSTLSGSSVSDQTERSISKEALLDRLATVRKNSRSTTKRVKKRMQDKLNSFGVLVLDSPTDSGNSLPTDRPSLGVVEDSAVPETQPNDGHDPEKQGGVIHETPEELMGTFSSTTSESTESRSSQSKLSDESLTDIDPLTRSILEKTRARNAALMKRIKGDVQLNKSPKRPEPVMRLFPKQKPTASSITTKAPRSNRVEPTQLHSPSLTDTPPACMDVSLQVSFTDSAHSDNDDCSSDNSLLDLETRIKSVQISMLSSESSFSESHPSVGESPICTGNISEEMPIVGSCVTVSSDNDDLNFSTQLSRVASIDESSPELPLKHDKRGNEDTHQGISSSDEDCPKLQLSVSHLTPNQTGNTLPLQHIRSDTTTNSDDDTAKTTSNNLSVNDRVQDQSLESDVSSPMKCNISLQVSLSESFSPEEQLSQAFHGLGIQSPKAQREETSLGRHHYADDSGTADISRPLFAVEDSSVISETSPTKNTSENLSPHSDDSLSSVGSLYKTAFIDSDDNVGETEVKSHKNRRRTVYLSLSDDDDDDETREDSLATTSDPKDSYRAPQPIVLSDSEDSDDNCFDIGKMKRRMLSARSQNAGVSEEDSMEDFKTNKPRTKVTNREKRSTAKEQALPRNNQPEFCTPNIPRPNIVHQISDSSDSGDEAFEQFIRKSKESRRPQERQNDSMDDFIVDDDEIENYSPTFHRTVDSTHKKHKTKTPRRRYTICEDEDGVIYRTPTLPPARVHKSAPRPPRLPSTSYISPNPRPLSLITNRDSGSESPVCSFLRSLSDEVPVAKKHPDAKRFATGFKKLKAELSAKLFRLFNETVFENKLPADLELTWSPRMTKTAGCCTYKKRSATNIRSAIITLSGKVCDTPERVRDTLIHEMCHAAVWLIHGQNDHHGPFWQHFARKANRIHRDLPVIGRCHTYDIQTKFTYRCTRCGQEIGRHSKSLDLSKKVCGVCQGTFELLVNSTRGAPTTPRTPNAFALFVKDQYSAVKQRNRDRNHRDIMKQLAADFAEKNKVTSD